MNTIVNYGGPVLQRIEHRSKKVSKRERERENHLVCMTMHGKGKGWGAIYIFD